MDFLQEIKPYLLYIDLYHKGKQMPPYEVNLKISEIYDRLRKHESVKIYGFQNNDIATTDLGCSSCISDMMNNLRNWIVEKSKTIAKPTVEFKGVPIKWGEFKKYCSSKGINIKSKTRVELMNELKTLENANS
jgi:hypothetical protein